jgi:hypothetical protein
VVERKRWVYIPAAIGGVWRVSSDGKLKLVSLPKEGSLLGITMGR